MESKTCGDLLCFLLLSLACTCAAVWCPASVLAQGPGHPGRSVVASSAYRTEPKPCLCALLIWMGEPETSNASLEPVFPLGPQTCKATHLSDGNTSRGAQDATGDSDPEIEDRGGAEENTNTSSVVSLGVGLNRGVWCVFLSAPLGPVPKLDFRPPFCGLSDACLSQHESVVSGAAFAGHTSGLAPQPTLSCSDRLAPFGLQQGGSSLELPRRAHEGGAPCTTMESGTRNRRLAYAHGSLNLCYAPRLSAMNSGAAPAVIVQQGCGQRPTAPSTTRPNLASAPLAVAWLLASGLPRGARAMQTTVAASVAERLKLCFRWLPSERYPADDPEASPPIFPEVGRRAAWRLKRQNANREGVWCLPAQDRRASVVGPRGESSAAAGPFGPAGRVCAPRSPPLIIDGGVREVPSRDEGRDAEGPGGLQALPAGLCECLRGARLGEVVLRVMGLSRT